MVGDLLDLSRNLRRSPASAGAVMLANDYFDVLSVGVPTAVLIVVGAGAVLPAARRAARTDPLIALRSE